jgi:hypothetical protein
MDIQQAINLLTTENHRYFVEQINHFSIDKTSPLIDYLDFINSDIIGWFKSAPENIKAESTYYKFKSPINNLLERPDVIEQYGLTYCTTLAKNITKTFSKHKQDIIKRSKNININEDTYANSDTSSETNYDTDDEPEDKSSIPDPVYEDPKLKKETVDDYTKKLQILDSQLQDALTKIKILETSLHHITQERDNYLKLLMK